MSVWPATLPQQPVFLPISLSGPENAVLRTNMDVGPAKQRPRTRAAVRPVSLTFAPLTEDQYNTFEEWFETDLGMGPKSFALPHPVTDQIKVFRFPAGQSPYTWSPIGKNAYRLRVSLEMLP